MLKWSHNFQTFQGGLDETQEGANGLIGAIGAPLSDYFLALVEISQNVTSQFTTTCDL